MSCKVQPAGIIDAALGTSFGAFGGSVAGRTKRLCVFTLLLRSSGSVAVLPDGIAASAVATAAAAPAEAASVASGILLGAFAGFIIGMTNCLRAIVARWSGSSATSPDDIGAAATVVVIVALPDDAAVAIVARWSGSAAMSPDDIGALGSSNRGCDRGTPR